MLCTDVLDYELRVTEVEGWSRRAGNELIMSVVELPPPGDRMLNKNNRCFANFEQAHIENRATVW